ncbi:hypothetical protein NF212_05790 [Parasalinivibrio latis]|uniref:hypothetical protein n=1 Tax=Parasalinivibrio latis TaxID=2952610 RepID=UPI0030E1C167
MFPLFGLRPNVADLTGRVQVQQGEPHCEASSNDGAFLFPLSGLRPNVADLTGRVQVQQEEPHFEASSKDGAFFVSSVRTPSECR